MVSLGALWLPIVLSTVIVFFGSSIIYTLVPYHRNDYKALPDEDKVLAILRGAGIKPGLYRFPFSTQQEMKSPAIQEKLKQGPVGLMTIRPSGLVVMPKFLGLWFGYCLVVSFFVAYLAGHTISAGAPYRGVFRVVGTAAFLAYGLGHLSDGIWKGQPWGVTLKEVFDGLIYGLLTAGTFGWLWPR